MPTPDVIKEGASKLVVFRGCSIPNPKGSKCDPDPESNQIFEGKGHSGRFRLSRLVDFTGEELMSLELTGRGRKVLAGDFVKTFGEPTYGGRFLQKGSRKPPIMVWRLDRMVQPIRFKDQE